MVPVEAFRFNRSASVEQLAVGAAGAPLLIVDDVFADPGAMVAAIGGLKAPLPHPHDFYPGARYPLQEEFHQAFVVWLNTLAPKPSLLARSVAASEQNGYVSVVTKPAAELLPIQTIPHFDTTDDQIFAAVIYLFESGFGGTSFYRHRSTGQELLTRQSESLYRAVLRSEIQNPAALPRKYRNGDDSLFERIHRQEPRFNRMVFYPGRIFHSGDIAPDYAGAQGPADGRLTVTTLCRLTPLKDA